MVDMANDEFGRGYTAGQTGRDIAIKTAVALERERIIKMLEEIDNRRTHAESLQCGFCDAVAFIKGKAE